METKQLWTVKAGDDGLLAWTIRDNRLAAKGTYIRKFPEPPWRELEEQHGYSVVKVRLVEEEAGDG